MYISAFDIEEVWVICKYDGNIPVIYRDLIFTSLEEAEKFYSLMLLSEEYTLYTLEEYIDRRLECD